MANIQEVLRYVSKRQEVHRAGVGIYHVTLRAGSAGQRVEGDMIATEVMLLAATQQLIRIQRAVEFEDLAEAKRLLAAEIEEVVIPQGRQAPQAKPT